MKGISEIPFEKPLSVLNARPQGIGGRLGYKTAGKTPFQSASTIRLKVGLGRMA